MPNFLFPFRLLFDFLADEVVVHGELAVDVPEVLEVLDGPDLEVEGRVLIADHQSAGVLLESRNGPHVVHSFFDRLFNNNNNNIIFSSIFLSFNKKAIFIRQFWINIYMLPLR